MNPQPFYPCQVESGATYVMDGRFNPPRIVSTVFCSFDTAERWHIAKLRAERLNHDHVRRTFAVRQRVAIGLLALLFVLFLIEVASGDLSAAVSRAISAAL